MQCFQQTSELIPEILSFLSKYEQYVIIGHKEPDGDCIGSQLALGRYLTQQGKHVHIVSAGPFLRTEIKSFECYFEKTLPVFSDSTALIIIDCSNISRTGFESTEFPEILPMLFIDHHASGRPEGQICFVDIQAPATAFLIQEILEEAHYALSKEIAELLFFGVATDTGFFRHLETGSGKYFNAVARLVDAGASPKQAYYAMSGGKQLGNRKLLGELLLRTESYYNNQLLFSWLTLSDQERYGVESRDSDMLYQLLMTVENSEVVVIIRQEKPDYCTIGLRSKAWVDVGKIAESFGGGGHKHAAGAYVQSTLEDLKPHVLHAFESILQ